MSPKILVFAGSARTQSWNKKLARVAAASAREAGAEITWIDLRDMPVPLYDGDLEASSGLPEGAKTLKRAMIEQNGFLISAPEYNSSISAVLKNAIDMTNDIELAVRRAGQTGMPTDPAAARSSPPRAAPRALSPP